jgi:micrococcal nuclease
MNAKTQRIIVTIAIMVVIAVMQNYATPKSVTESPSASASVVKTPTAVVKEGFYRVTHVVDGDTIEVDLNGANQKVRLIGINTPETVDPRKKVECFGKEASAHAKETLTDANVKLEADPTQDDTDKYGRILRYVILEDGTNFNLQQIADGYAYEYTYSKKYRYQKEFRAAQASAKAGERGLWSPATCNGVK